MVLSLGLVGRVWRSRASRTAVSVPVVVPQARETPPDTSQRRHWVSSRNRTKGAAPLSRAQLRVRGGSVKEKAIKKKGGWLPSCKFGRAFAMRTEHSPSGVCVVRHHQYITVTANAQLLSLAGRMSLQPRFWLSSPRPCVPFHLHWASFV